MADENRLRQALGEIAQEEAEQFEQSMTRDERRRAEDAYRHHKRRALALIGRQTGRHASYTGMFLKAVAVLAIVIGGVILYQQRSPREVTPLTPGSQGTVAPFYTFTPSPTQTPEPTPIPTIAPTETPIITEKPTESPTDTPIPTDAPTPTPTPVPTPEPTETPEAGMVDAAPPASWQGSFFPGQVPAGYAPDRVESKDGVSVASFVSGTDRIVFTERNSFVTLSIPDGADVSYVQWEGVVALRAETDGEVILIWDQDGHSFSLAAASGGAAEAVAATVKKIP